MAVDLYQRILRPLLFSGLKTDPEWLHKTTLQWLAGLNERREEVPIRWLLAGLRQRCTYLDPRLHQSCLGLSFANPVGLAAGFDKDGLVSGLWSDFGFGFAELGTVTWQAQPGNPQPRLFRLLDDEAVLNRMGFNNLGAQALAERLRQVNPRPDLGPDHSSSSDVASSALAPSQPGQNHSSQNHSSQNHSSQNHSTPHPAFPLGINLGKSKVTPLDQALEDYCASFKALKHLGDYFVVNVSSPNTPGLRQLQAAEQLTPILSGLQALNHQRRPLLLKIAPDLSDPEISDILEVALAQNLAGIIATNTTIDRSGLKTQRLAATGNLLADEAGGISGAPLRQRSTEVIRFIYKETQGQLPIIGVGGVASAADAWDKITAGASLVQLYSGWVYQGPEMMRHLLRGLVVQLEQNGLSSIHEAVGLAHGPC